MQKFVDGTLLIYYEPLTTSPPTIREHINSFSEYSKSQVWEVNTSLGFPKAIKNLRFKTIVLHYSPFGRYPFLLPNAFLEYIECCDQSLKVAFFQDEHQNCQERFSLVNRLKIDIIYSLLDPIYFEEVYLKNTSVNKVLHTLTGFVGDDLVLKAGDLVVPRADRTIDVGYRARPLPYYMGKGAQEKTDIAYKFLRFTKGTGLKLDIKTGENDRIYGDDWYKFVSNCRFMIGVEAGVSVFDLDGSVKQRVDEFLKLKPDATFENVFEAELKDLDGNIFYRTISPRVFEAVIFKVGLILFEGKYNSILEPYKHYIPLKKDFSNIEEVLNLMGDEMFVEEMLENAMTDLVKSKKFDYQYFINDFNLVIDSEAKLMEAEFITPSEVDQAFNKGLRFRETKAKLKSLRHSSWPGREVIKKAYKTIFGNN